MPRTNTQPKVESINFRVDPELKAAFAAATAQEDKPAGQVLREFMRGYIERRQFQLEARRHAHVAAALAADPSSDEAEVMRWIENVSDTTGWTA